MIIFGTRGVMHSASDVLTFRCRHCGNFRHVGGGLVRYFHLYWIPCFAYELQPITQCLHCRNTLQGEQIPAEIRTGMVSTIFAWSKIWWCFIGLLLGGLAILWSSVGALLA